MSPRIFPFHLKELEKNRNFDFIVNNFLFFFQWQQQRTQNEILLSYIEWNVDLKISRRGTKSVASAFSVFTLRALWASIPQMDFPFHSRFGTSAVKI